MTEDKMEEKTKAFFAKEFTFSFDSLHHTLDFFDNLREFSHHLSENHYYSESINKRVMAINFDIHMLSLELPMLEAEGGEFYEAVNTMFLAESKPQVKKAEFQDFTSRLTKARKKAFDINLQLQQLVKEIKQEYASKNGGLS